MVLKPFHIVPLILQEDRDEVLGSLLRTMAGGRVSTARFRIRRPDGQQRLLLGRAYLKTDARGMRNTVEGSLQDITQSPHSGRPSDRGSNRSTYRIGVVVVGRDRFSRAGIASILAMNPQIQVVGEASIESTDSREPGLLSQTTSASEPAIVVVDVDAPGPEFIAFVRNTLESDPRVQILTLIRYEALDLIASLTVAGVSRLLLSDVPTDELTRTVVEMASGHSQPGRDASSDVLFGEFRPGFQGPQQLTATEARVLRLLVVGRRNREIAAELFISVPTVKRHTQQIYRKLGARDRAHAAALANHYGLAR